MLLLAPFVTSFPPLGPAAAPMKSISPRAFIRPTTEPQRESEGVKTAPEWKGPASIERSAWIQRIYSNSSLFHTVVEPRCAALDLLHTYELTEE